MRCQDQFPESVRSRLFGLSAPRQLRLWAFATTPLTPAHTIDEEALARHVADICEPADCVVVMGAIAEVDHVTDDEWQRCVTVAADVVPPATPLIVGLPADPERALRLAPSIDRTGALAVLVLLDDADAAAHVAAIAQRSRRPVIPYLRRPEQAEPGLVQALLSTGVVVGVKDGLRDPLAYRRLRAELGEVPVGVAWEDVALGYWAYGVEAVSPASAAHDPAYARHWIDALNQHGVDEARRLLDLFGHPFSDLRRSRPGLEIACVKYALALRGGCTPVMRAPAAELTGPEQQEVRRLLDALDGTDTEPPAR